MEDFAHTGAALVSAGNRICILVSSGGLSEAHRGCAHPHAASAGFRLTVTAKMTFLSHLRHSEAQEPLSQALECFKRHKKSGFFLFLAVFWL